jgi:hypothetical protein
VSLSASAGYSCASGPRNDTRRGLTLALRIGPVSNHSIGHCLVPAIGHMIEANDQAYLLRRGRIDGRMRPTPIPQKPLISSERAQLLTIHPPPTGTPFSGATTKNPTSAPRR